MDNLGKIGRSLMDNWGEIRQLINILFCGYRNLYSSGAQGAPASNNKVCNENCVLILESLFTVADNLLPIDRLTCCLKPIDDKKYCILPSGPRVIPP
jgi:hypothetical protein